MWDCGVFSLLWNILIVRNSRIFRNWELSLSLLLCALFSLAGVLTLFRVYFWVIWLEIGKLLQSNSFVSDVFWCIFYLFPLYIISLLLSKKKKKKEKKKLFAVLWLVRALLYLILHDFLLLVSWAWSCFFMVST